MVKDPVCVGRCDHFFCSSCLKTREESNCPICKLPAPPAERKPDRIVSTLLTSTSELIKLLSTTSKLENGCGVAVPSNDPSCTTFTSMDHLSVLKPIEDNTKSSTTTPNSAKVSEKRKRNSKKKIDSNTELDLSVNKSATKKLQFVTTKSNISITSGRESTDSNVKLTTKSNISITSGRESTDSNVKHNKTKEKLITEQPMDCPATPDNKKFKIPDLSILGISPATPFINKRNSKGETSLHVACVKGDIERTKSLLIEGANPNTKDNAGWTPLHEACSHGFKNIAELLLNYGALVDVPGGDDSETPLHDAVSHGLEDIILLLRRWGASDSFKDRVGRTPRTIASLCVGVKEMHNALDTTADALLKHPVSVPPILDKMVILDLDLSSEYKKKLEKLGKILRVKVVTEFSNEVTHVVADCEGDDNKVVSKFNKHFRIAVVSGKLIISHKWVDECLSVGGPVSHYNYEVYGLSHSSQFRAPIKANDNANKMLPGLFKGFHMYLLGSFTPPSLSKKDLEGLIKAGGGIVVNRQPNPESIPNTEMTVPFHTDPNGALAKCSHVLIYEQGTVEPQLKYDMTHVKTLPLSWVLDCIDHFQIVPPYK